MEAHPKQCLNCVHRIISRASGLQRIYKELSVSTCGLHHSYHSHDSLRGTYQTCDEVVNTNKCLCLKEED